MANPNVNGRREPAPVRSACQRGGRAAHQRALRQRPRGAPLRGARARSARGPARGRGADAGAARDADVDGARDGGVGARTDRGRQAVPALMAALRGDQAPSVRKQAAWALGQIEDRASVDALGAALRDANVDVRRTAVWALGQIEDPRAVAAARPRRCATTTPRCASRRRGRSGRSRAATRATRSPAALRDASADVREMAAWALGQIEDPRSVPRARRRAARRDAGGAPQGGVGARPDREQDAVPALVARAAGRRPRGAEDGGVGARPDRGSGRGAGARRRCTRSTDAELRRIGGARAVADRRRGRGRTRSSR